MKRSFPVNFEQKIYYIDEDAYQLIQTYFDQLKETFKGEEGEEIVNDITHRVSELFSEAATTDKSILTIEDVKRVISIVGSPEQLGEYSSTDSSGAQPDSNASAESSTSSSSSHTTPPPYDDSQFKTETNQVERKLYRDIDDKILGGVLSGLAHYMNANVTVVRLVVILIAMVFHVIPIISYIIALILIKPADTPRRRLEMRGIPVTPTTIAQNAWQDVAPQSSESSTSANEIFTCIFKFIIGGAGAIAGAIGISTIIAAIYFVVIGIVASTCGIDAAIVHNSDFIMEAQFPILRCVAMALILFAIALPALTLCWAACCAVFKTRGPGNIGLISGIILEVILILAATLLGYAL